MKKIWNCTLATFSCTMLKLSPKLLTINYWAGKKSGLFNCKFNSPRLFVTNMNFLSAKPKKLVAFVTVLVIILNSDHSYY